ncbi:MAG: efflux transporter periplasmic adaptor subunit [Betaproteobacteria bacterium HGW-Betaproteobacteria-3]|jgi:membrane fusion protein (multidrug efflux system)|nr:MAG: efflux transporter periplasmic adaptor subunit [Betaproteobacteria bacterium HGW-Betaproteobacteria-3]
MASRFIYTTIAAVGIGVASGGAWWYQNKRETRPLQGGGGADVGVVSAKPAPGASGPGAAPVRPVSVEVARVEVTRLTDDMQAVGSLRSRQSVVVRPEVSGRITQLNFRDGVRVKKGQLLVQLDDQLQLAQVQQSEAELSIAQANHKRNQELVAQGFISQRSVDESAANLQVAQAKLALARATAARLRIVAPFDGITGIRTVNVGDYLKDGADVVNIEDMDAVFVDYRLPERFQSRIRRGQQATVELDALPGQAFSAVIQAIDPLIDANGRSVGVRGCIDNRRQLLRPGMFARINTVFSERAKALVIPEEAIVPQGTQLHVLKLRRGDGDTLTTQRVEVKVGLRRPGHIEIVEGLQAGDTVVTAGHQRIQRDGTLVRVANALRAAQDADKPAPDAPSRTASRGPAAGTPPSAVLPAGPNPCLASQADLPQATPATTPGKAAPAGGPARESTRNPA